MADRTTNIGLLKPTEQDYMQISVLNENMDTIDRELHRRGTTVNGITPDATGDYVVDEVPFAREIVSGASQPSHEEFLVRTTGGHARLSDGSATLISIHGRSRHTGIVPESLTIEVDAATRTVDPETSEIPPDITATIDRDTFVAYVNQSGNITLLYTDAWSANPSLYGVTVTGEPVSGDQIIITYIKENRGTISHATPTSFISTGWNLYDHSLGYAKVLKYSNTYGFLVGGTYTDVEFSETLLGEKETITPVSGYFSIPSDGYIWITGGNDTDTYVLMTWSDWSEGYDGDFMPYFEDEIDLSGLFGTGNFFENGMMQVGGVTDEIDFDMGYAISRIERLAYSAENLAIAEASGREYECDANYIYLVRELDVREEINISGVFAAYDHGMEYIGGTDIPVFVETLYGENLVEKLRTNVVTISAQQLTDAQKDQICQNLGISRSTLREVPVSVAVSDWSSSSNQFVANFLTSYVTTTSKEFLFYDGSLEQYGKAHILSAKKSGAGGITFTTAKKPTGTITATLYIFDNDDGKLPVLLENTVVSIANGGTGQSSLAGVKQAFGITGLENSLAIVATGNNHIAVASGQYVYVTGHATLTEGLYKATTAIAANATLSLSNLSAVSNGGLNAINEQMANIDISSNLTKFPTATSVTDFTGNARKVGKIVTFSCSFKYTGRYATVAVFATGYRPQFTSYLTCAYLKGGYQYPAYAAIQSNGEIFVMLPESISADSVYISGTFAI